MKTKPFFLLSVLVLCIISTSLVANDGNAYAEAKEELENDINWIVNDVPFDDLYKMYVSNKVEVRFVVDTDRNLRNIRVMGENKELVAWTKYQIENSNIQTSPFLIGHAYSMKINFVNGSRPIY